MLKETKNASGKCGRDWAPGKNHFWKPAETDSLGVKGIDFERGGE